LWLLTIRCGRANTIPHLVIPEIIYKMTDGHVIF
jgi:hypothetical protein